MVLLNTPMAVELSVWMDEGTLCHPISMVVWRKGIISFAVTNSAPSSDSDAKYMKNLIMEEMVRIGPLNEVKGLFYERSMQYPTRLHGKRSFRYEASECSAKIISLAL